MALYKESMINKIENDLAGRNQNWEAIDDHIAALIGDDAHGWESASRYAIGDFSRSSLEASGRQKIVTGFKPQVVLALATVNGSADGRHSVGFGSPIANFCLWKDVNNNNQTTEWLIAIRQGATSSIQYLGKIDEMVADGFMIEWLKGGASLDETISVGYLAFR